MAFDPSTARLESGFDPSTAVEADDDSIQNAPISKADAFRAILGINDRTPLDSVRDIAAGLVSGLGKGGQFVASTLTGGHAPKGDVDALANMIASKKQSTAGDFLKGIGEYAPYAELGGARLLPELSKAGSLSTPARNFIANLLSKPGQLSAGVLSGAATTNPDEQNLGGILPSGRTGGAIEGALTNALTSGLAKGLESLRPSNLVRGVLTPDQLTKNLDLTSGTETPLGEVIDSPALKRLYENVLSRVPFSGASQATQRVGKDIQSRGSSILSNMLGSASPENIPDQIANEMKSSFDEHEKKKNDLYTKANRIADKVNLNLELPSFAKLANKYSNAIADTSMLKYEPDMASVFNKLKNYKNPVQETTNTGALVDKFGTPLIQETSTSYPSLQEANILKSKLNRYSTQYGSSPSPDDRRVAGIYGSLAQALGSDIETSIDNSGSKELKDAFTVAQKNYAKNFSPFLDKKIYKYINGDKNPETMVRDFIKTSPVADLASSISDIQNILRKPESKAKLAYSYFSRALDDEGELQPAKLSTAINKLGKNQLKALVPDQQLRNQLKDYSKLQGMNKDAHLTMFNPKTGQQNLDLDVLKSIALGSVGHMLGGNIGALGSALGSSLGANLATKALTSENIRNAIVKEMIKNRPKFTRSGAIPSYQSAVQALTKALSGNNNQ